MEPVGDALDQGAHLDRGGGERIRDAHERVLLRRWGGGTCGARASTREVIRPSAWSNAAGEPLPAGSGIDQCKSLVSAGNDRSSSWAMSHTVTTRSGLSVTSSIDRVRDPRRSRPALAAASIASRRTRSAGLVPALEAGISCRAFHTAAASWDRAEFAVHTNRTWRATSVATGSVITETATETRRTYRRRASPAEASRSTTPTSSKTRRGGASRLEPIPSDAPSPEGDRSDIAS